MTNAQRRAKIQACKRLVANAGATEGERAAAREAINRLMRNAPPSFARTPKVVRPKVYRPKRSKKKTGSKAAPMSGMDIFMGMAIAFMAGLSVQQSQGDDEDGWL